MACDRSALERIKNDQAGATTADLVASIECLQEEVNKLSGEIDRASSSAGNFVKKIGQGNDLLASMKGAVVSVGQSMKDFVKDTSAQYRLAEEIAKEYKKTGLSIGLSVKNSKGLAKSMKGAMVEISKFGGSLSDAGDVYRKFAENSGRVRILGDEEVSNIYKLGAATDLYGDKAASLMETLDLMGVSNVSAYDRMNDLVKESQELGLNASKVMNVLADNMNSMQSYSFSKGVKGMTQMAKLGVKLRMDVGTMLSMADKFYEPEAAIEAAANLQMIGGDIAKAFGDPFETMYLARNKPEELAEKLQDMTENMMTFNSETGEYEFPAEVRMQLKSAGEQLGINTEKMIEMARQTSKIKDVKDRLSMSNMFDEKEMEGIASMARIQDGEFVVDMRNEDGEKITQSIDSLTNGDYEMLLKPPDSETDYMTDMLYNSQTTNERLANIEKSFEYGFIDGAFDVYGAIEESTDSTIAALTAMGANAATSLANELKNMDALDILKFDPESVDQEMTKVVEKMGQVFENYTAVINEGSFDIETGTLTATNLNVSGQVGQNPSQPSVDPEEFCKDKGGYNAVQGKCNDGSKPMKTGGMVPAGFPNDTYPARLSSGETVLPDPVNLKTVLSSIGVGNNSGNMDLGGNINVNITAPSGFGNYSDTQKQEIKDLAFQQIKRYLISKDGQTNTPTSGNIESITNNQLK
jgi:hypothetical protein